jgi:hypothetical protein
MKKKIEGFNNDAVVQASNETECSSDNDGVEGRDGGQVVFGVWKVKKLVSTKMYGLGRRARL